MSRKIQLIEDKRQLVVDKERLTFKRKNRSRNIATIVVMLAVLAILLVIATAIGTVNVPFFQTVKIILKHWGLLQTASFSEGQDAIIYLIRFPEVLVAALVGTALATSGTVMQGMFRNPMADPGIIGVSSGAGLGAVMAIALGLSSKSMFFIPLFALTGAAAAAFIIFILSLRGGKVPALTLILAGIAVSTFIGAVTSAILSVLCEYQVKQFVFWTIGGLDARRWEHVAIASPVLICVLLLFLFAKDLNILLLGEEEAQSIGLNPSKARKILLFLASTTTALAVSVSGNISFVGLIVPHIIRLIVGPDHRILLPASAIGGAIFLVACDLIARILIIPHGIRVGIVTSILGAPYFLYLLNKTRREGSVL